MTKRTLLYVVCFAMLFSPYSWSDALLKGRSEGMNYQLDLVAEGFSLPWAMAFLNDQNLLITEREGNLKRLNRVTGRIVSIKGVPPVYSEGQGGLLDVALPPGYTDGGWVYFTYSKAIGDSGVTTLARAKLRDDALHEWHDLLVTKSLTDTNRHFGSRIAFDGKGHVFFSIGDRGQRPNGQNLLTHAGSVLRLKLDGSVPTDNPFVKREAALPELWSYGHRNPQGLSYDFQHQRLWLIEHGPRGGDELNLIRPGKNYGWPVISYGKEYWGPFNVGEATSKPGMEQPVKVYVPSIAPGSLLHYTGAAFPNWQGDLLAGALKLQHLNRIQLNDSAQATGEERLLEKLNERIRSLAQSPEGWLYLSTDSGKILRLSPSP